MASVDDQRPIWDLSGEAAGELDSPMTAQDILDWFTEHHPDVLPHTLRSQIAVAVGNRRSYLNHHVYSRRPPLLWAVGRGRYEPYELERHGEPEVDVDEDPGEDQTPEARPPVWQLIAQAAHELVAPFSLQAVVDWFEDNYPDIPAGTVRTQVSDWSGNSPAYIFNPAFNRRRPVLWRVARGQYEPYDERRHGEVVAGNLEAAEASAADSVEAVQEFVLEQYLEEFLFLELGRNRLRTEPGTVVTGRSAIETVRRMAGWSYRFPGPRYRHRCPRRRRAQEGDSTRRGYRAGTAVHGVGHKRTGPPRPTSRRHHSRR